MKNKIIELIEYDIEQTKKAFLTGTYLNPLNNFIKGDVTDENKKSAQHIINYLEQYLIPEIKKLNE